MNERIKQIAKESGLYIAYDNRAVTDKELEFFAELIIRECAKVVENALDVSPVSHEAYSWADGDTVLEHFGVE